MVRNAAQTTITLTVARTKWRESITVFADHKARKRQTRAIMLASARL